MTAAAYAYQRDGDLTTLASALVAEGHLSPGGDVLDWLDAARERQPLHVERISLFELDRWGFHRRPMRLVHDSGKFFAVEGIRTVTDYGPAPQWDQPIVNQPEIGILGILTRVVGGLRYYLMQAKVEPGNVGGAQISPTLQATRSNYTRVHQGRTPKYLEYFTGELPVRVLMDQLQSEQASRFLGKRNRNLIVETQDDVPVEEGFRWMTLGEIKHLLRLDNIVNMDARSVISCIPLPASQVLTLSPKLTNFGASLLDSALSAAQSQHTTGEILKWLSRLRATYHRQVAPRGLDRLEDWLLIDGELCRRDRRYFSVMGVRVEIRGREVARWSQPLLHHPGRGLNGMVTQKIGDVLHFLIRACSYPGNRDMFELGPTVSRSDYAGQFDRPEAPPFLDLFRDPAPSTLRFSSIQSEEGGRFFQYQNQYVILELPAGRITKIPEGFVWMTLGQIQELMPHGYFNIEARNLFACLHLI